MVSNYHVLTPINMTSSVENCSRSTMILLKTVPKEKFNRVKHKLQKDSHPDRSTENHSLCQYRHCNEFEDECYSRIKNVEIEDAESRLKKNRIPYKAWRSHDPTLYSKLSRSITQRFNVPITIPSLRMLNPDEHLSSTIRV